MAKDGLHLPSNSLKAETIADFASSTMKRSRSRLRSWNPAKMRSIRSLSIKTSACDTPSFDLSSTRIASSPRLSASDSLLVLFMVSIMDYFIIIRQARGSV
jgi:hypothetical protein